MSKYTEEIWNKISIEEQNVTENRQLVESVRAKKRSSISTFFKDMLFGLGLKNTFYGIYDVLFLLLSLTVGIFALLILFIPEQTTIYGITFSLSPLLNSVFFFLCIFKEKEVGIYSIKMSCHYTVFHLTAFRMFIVGLFNLLVNTGLIGILSSKMEIDFLLLLSISCSSLFLFAFISIISLLKLSVKGLIIPCVLSAISLFFAQQKEWNAILQNIPLVAYAVLAILCICLYMAELATLNKKSAKIRN